MATEKGRKRSHKRRKVDNPAQSKRFEEAVRNLGLDESGEAFKRAMDKIAPKKPKGGSS